jgi:hypothetical protein
VLYEGIGGLTARLDVAEYPTVHGLFLERAVEAIGHLRFVACGLSHNSAVRRDALRGCLQKWLYMWGVFLHGEVTP